MKIWVCGEIVMDVRFFTLKHFLYVFEGSNKKCYKINNTYIEGLKFKNLISDEFI